MQRLDALTSAAMALVFGMIHAIVCIRLTGFALAVAWPEWYAPWAERSPVAAMRVWDGLVVLACWVLPGGALAWLMVGPGRIRHWRYALLAPVPAAVWFLAWPLLEGRAPAMTAEFVLHPVVSTVQIAAVLLPIPVFACLFARRRPAPA